MRKELTEILDSLKSMREGLPAHKRGLAEHLGDAERALTLAVHDLRHGNPCYPPK